MTEVLTQTNKKISKEASAEINRIARKLAARVGSGHIIVDSPGEKNFALITPEGTQLARVGNTVSTVNIYAQQGMSPSGESLVQPGQLSNEAVVKPMAPEDIRSSAAGILNTIRKSV